MERQKAHLTLVLDTSEPMELASFVGAFTSIGNEFKRFISERYPDHDSDIQFFVKEVRAGSVVADLLAGLVSVPGIIDVLDQIIVFEEFLRRWGGCFRALIAGNKDQQPSTKQELKDWADAVVAIAKDPQASHRLEAAVFEDGERQVRAAFTFDTIDARAAQQAIEDRTKELEKTSHADHIRVLMTFTRSDVHNADVGKRSGERVVISQISEKPLALMYGSGIAEHTIKAEIRESSENVYKKGFVVDVNVESRNGKPIAYSITDLHQVIDLPDE